MNDFEGNGLRRQPEGSYVQSGPTTPHSSGWADDANIVNPLCSRLTSYDGREIRLDIRLERNQHHSDPVRWAPSHIVLSHPEKGRLRLFVMSQHPSAYNSKSQNCRPCNPRVLSRGTMLLLRDTRDRGFATRIGRLQKTTIGNNAA
jgi:hypothetical protein